MSSQAHLTNHAHVHNQAFVQNVAIQPGKMPAIPSSSIYGNQHSQIVPSSSQTPSSLSTFNSHNAAGNQNIHAISHPHQSVGPVFPPTSSHPSSSNAYAPPNVHRPDPQPPTPPSRKTSLICSPPDPSTCVGDPGMAEYLASLWKEPIAHFEAQAHDLALRLQTCDAREKQLAQRESAVGAREIGLSKHQQMQQQQHQYEQSSGWGLPPLSPAEHDLAELRKESARLHEEAAVLREDNQKLWQLKGELEHHLLRRAAFHEQATSEIAQLKRMREADNASFQAECDRLKREHKQLVAQRDDAQRSSQAAKDDSALISKELDRLKQQGMPLAMTLNSTLLGTIRELEKEVQRLSGRSEHSLHTESSLISAVHSASPSSKRSHPPQSWLGPAEHPAFVEEQSDFGQGDLNFDSVALELELLNRSGPRFQPLFLDAPPAGSQPEDAHELQSATSSLRVSPRSSKRKRAS
ncbi:hypothetical protein FISHEDRAFT_78954 [Fistulina hepatica ATCC 64428]|uniref:Uncharacterized protein n=1 Tax=Fistulina hepatica ATCC 64428 TaxID=1128425 RepID=A0A0D7A224_9AGAR|nr:hypothetical protein FISHEDRAFT_78954 [Fistulina hepatica ATCC 64428]